MGARFILDPVVAASYWWYRHTDRTPTIGYSAMRKLFGSPRASRLDELAERSTREHPVLDLDGASGVVHDPPTTVVEALRRDGIAILDSRLPEWLCEGLVELATSATCVLVDRYPDAPPYTRFEPINPKAVRYDLREADLLASPAVQQLVADRSVLAIAQEYLGGAPVQDLVAMWWTARSPMSSSVAAQQFHFDLDRLRFLKLFVYLTDVGLENGPHVYVRGSHRLLPPDLREDRRFGDAEIEGHFEGADILSVAGPRGTMFFADTRGLHKGVNSVEGHRLVFQLEYATSLFGAAVDRCDVPVAADALAFAVDRYPSTYRRFDVRI